METSPLISVVIPVYCRTPDHQRFLTEALESLARQTFRDFEVVLVDDFSPLDIEPLVEAVNGLPHARLLRNPAKRGTCLLPQPGGPEVPGGSHRLPGSRRPLAPG